MEEISTFQRIEANEEKEEGMRAGRKGYGRREGDEWKVQLHWAV